MAGGNRLRSKWAPAMDENQKGFHTRNEVSLRFPALWGLEIAGFALPALKRSDTGDYEAMLLRDLDGPQPIWQQGLPEACSRIVYRMSLTGVGPRL